MAFESLTGEDASLLYAEAPGTQLQIGALCFFEGAPLRDAGGRIRVDELRRHVAARLAGQPRFRQRILGVPGDLAAPVWVDDPDFAVERHTPTVRVEPHPTALRDHLDHLLAEPLDPAHPLWDIHVVDGFGDVTPQTTDGASEDVVAVVVRAHHVMADGLALHAAATLLLDPVPRPPTLAPVDWSPAPHPGPVGLTARAVAERIRRQAACVGGLTRAVADPRRLGRNARLAAGALGALRHGVPPLAPALPLTGPVGRRRAFAWDSVPMADVVAVKERCGATVNDVVLAMAAGALRRMLEERGELDPTAAEPRALIPIGSPESTTSRASNRFSVTRVALPVAIDDPLERVRVVHERMHGHGPSTSQRLMSHIFSVADFVPPPVLRLAVPPVLAHQPLVNLAVSDIPGSRDALYLWESRLLGLHPFIDVVGNVALIIGVLSYVDDLGVGITVDPDVVGDPVAIAEHVRAAARELFEAAGRPAVA